MPAPLLPNGSRMLVTQQRHWV